MHRNELGDMNKCSYVAFLDVLGFSDLIANNDPQYIRKLYIDILRNTVGYTFGQLNEYVEAKGGFKHPNIQVISDSIIVWSEEDSSVSFYTLCAVVNIAYSADGEHQF